MSPSITRELTLAQARVLARDGRYAEAVDLLEDLSGDTSVAVLDLLARVHAQQGDLDRADQCWAQAEQIASGATEIAAGRRRIAAMRPAGRRRRTGRALLAACTVLVTAGALALLVDLRMETARLGAAQPPPAPAVVTQTVPAPPSPSAERDVLAGVRLQVPGVQVSRSRQEISVAFEEALFSEGATLTRRGRAVLKDLGARLRPYAGEIEVAVIGHTDRNAILPGGEYASNTDLGLARAVYVREVLRAASRIPTTRFAVSSMGGLMPPFRDDARNRTVTLRVSGAGAGAGGTR